VRSTGDRIPSLPLLAVRRGRLLFAEDFKVNPLEIVDKLWYSIYRFSY